MPTRPDLTETENERVREAAGDVAHRLGSQKAAAEALGISAAGLSALLTRKAGASFDLARRVARVAKVPLYLLLDPVVGDDPAYDISTEAIVRLGPTAVSVVELIQSVEHELVYHLAGDDERFHALRQKVAVLRERIAQFVAEVAKERGLSVHSPPDETIYVRVGEFLRPPSAGTQAPKQGPGPARRKTGHK